MTEGKKENVGVTLSIFVLVNRTVINAGGWELNFPCFYEHGPRLLSLENRRKIEPKEIRSCLIPHLLVVFTQHLEILVTALG